MKYAKGEMKKMSEGTSKKHPFIKGKHKTTVKHGKTDDKSKKPRIQGQK